MRQRGAQLRRGNAHVLRNLHQGKFTCSPKLDSKHYRPRNSLQIAVVALTCNKSKKKLRYKHYAARGTALDIELDCCDKLC